MSRLLFLGLLGAALVGAAAAEAMAQRDAGAKARGEFGRGFWAQPSRAFQAGPSFFYQPAPAIEGYRGFSYAPVEIDAGETAVVHVDNARLMVGRGLVGTLPAGHRFQVIRVVNGWLGAVTEVDGQALRGWVWHQNVVPEGVELGEPRAAAPPPPQTYQRFSYEPVETPAIVESPAIIQGVPTTRPAQRPAPPEVRLRPGTRRY